MRHIHPIQPILAVLLIVVFLYLRRRAAAKRSPAAPQGGRPESRAAAARMTEGDSPEAAYRNLRRKALNATPESLGLPGPLATDAPHAMLMEIGMSPIVTLASFANGDAGVYYQNGGGMIGGIAHESVRQAAKTFLAFGRGALPKLTRIANPPLPEPGNIRFNAVTAEGIFTAEVDREALADPGHDFSALFYAGQEVVTQMREAQQEKRPQ
jgi:hypothetical protein